PPAQLTVSPLTLNFGQVVIGQTSTKTLQLTNSGGGVLAGSASTTPPFAIQSGSPFSLTNGETRTLTVAFSPTASGSASTAVVFASNGGGSTNRLLGVGLTPPQLSVSPLNWNFGSIAVGDTVQATFVVTNLGGAPLSNGLATISGAPAAFTILSGTPFSL